MQLNFQCVLSRRSFLRLEREGKPGGNESGWDDGGAVVCDNGEGDGDDDGNENGDRGNSGSGGARQTRWDSSLSESGLSGPGRSNRIKTMGFLVEHWGRPKKRGKRQ